MLDNYVKAITFLLITIPIIAFGLGVLVGWYFL